MKILKRVFCSLLSLLLVCALLAPALAADEPYTYTVRIFAGNQGTINGESVYIIRNVQYGSTRSFNVGAVKVKDPNKYVPVGLREAGKDNSEVVTGIVVDADKDYVVAYAIPGDTVEYTVHYVDENGNSITAYDAYGNIVQGQKSFYGIKNTEVVISPSYLEGYTPNEPFITEKLSSNEADNQFYYYYTSNPNNNGGGNGGKNTGNPDDNQDNQDNQDETTPVAPTLPDMVLPEIIIPTPIIPVVPNVNPSGGNGFNFEDEDANGNNGDNDATNADADANGNNGDNDGSDEEGEAVSFMDIFDQDSPLAGMKKAVEYITQPGSPMAGWSAPAAVTTSVLIMLGIPALIVFLILFFKKKKDDEKDKKAKVK